MRPSARSTTLLRKPPTPNTAARNSSFSFIPFLWVPGVSGDLNVGGQSIDVDASIGDVFDAIIDNFEFAAMGRLEARHGRWGIALNLLYLTLGNQETGPLGMVTVDWDFEMTIAELFAMYRFATVPLGCGDACFRPTMTLDALGGARYLHSETKLAFAPGPNVDGSTDFVDPVVGLRAMFNVTPAVTFILMGNVGGFGVGSEFSWQAFAGVEWKIAPCFSLDAGWAVLSIDSEAGSNDFDLTLSGPAIGATFRF